MADMNALAEAVTKGDQNGAVEMTKAAMAEGMEVKKILDDGLILKSEAVLARATSVDTEPAKAKPADTILDAIAG